MKKALVLAVAVIAIVALGGAPAWAACGSPVFIGHAVDSFFLCDDSAPVQAFIYELGNPAQNSGSIRIDCRATGVNDPGLGLDCAAPGAGGSGDGQLAIFTDASIQGWNGCPADPGVQPDRIVAVVIDASGRSLMHSVSGLDPGLAFTFEAAQQFNEADGTVAPSACGSGNGRPQIRGMSVAGGTATIMLHQDRPTVLTDCDPGTLGQFLQAQGGASCVDNFDASSYRFGNLYTRVDTCPTTALDRRSLLLSQWTRSTVTPDASGDSTLVVPFDLALGQCLFLGGSGAFGTGAEYLSGYVAVPPQGAASPRAEEVRVARGQGKIDVSWVSRTEINLAAYKVLTDKKGLVELATVSPKGGGGAAAYRVGIEMSALKGGRSIIVRAVLNDGTTIDAAPVSF